MHTQFANQSLADSANQIAGQQFGFQSQILKAWQYADCRVRM